MPITQSRMVRLIRAADIFKSQILSSKQFVTEQCSALGPNCTREETLLTIQTIQNYFASLSLPLEELENLAAERAHFAQNAVRNNKQALREKSKRLPKTTAFRSTAPDTMNKTKSDWLSHAIAQTIPAPSTQGAAGLAMARAQAPQPQSAPPTPQSLSAQKLEYNKIAERFNMPIPYPDPHDDSQPLLPDWGGPTSDAMGDAKGDNDDLF